MFAVVDIAAATEISIPTAIIRIALAALLGSLIGAERQHHGRSAGFRTQLLVALGSAVAMVVSLQFGQHYGQAPAELSLIRVDPARVAYGVMTGVGFLGAGAVIRYGVNVRGLTTAASLWCTAAVGLATGFGMYAVATVATLLVVFTLLVLPKLDKLIPSRQYKSLVIEARSGLGITIDSLAHLLSSRNVKIVDVDYRHDFQLSRETFTLYVALLPRAKADDVLTIAADLPELISLTIH